ncbi:hypothetical protein FZEAL_3246 [Fusarium zealandicum]|uniref:chitinase n=1 Tax=Fusarium zealandicum TaxID=1053134 RepID=A0A8H4XMS7_9HYPO|nr:hypothetical protein FZEAL_3246 [Fusarium zealandicum]
MWKHIAVRIGLLHLASLVFAVEEASPFDPCPAKCSITGSNPLNWTHLHGVPALDRCDEPMLFDMMLSTQLDDPQRHITLRACTASEESTVQPMDYDPVPFVFGGPEKRAVGKDEDHESLCPADMHKSANETTIYYHEWLTDSNNKVKGSINHTTVALGKIKDYLDTAKDCKSTVLFAKSQQTIAGLYVGLSVGKKSAAFVVQELINGIKKKKNYEAGRIAVQNCHKVQPSVWGVGIIADLQGNITAVHESVAGWSDAKCVESPNMNTKWRNMGLNIWSINNAMATNGTVKAGNSTLTRRADECRAIEVESGDDCTTLAKRCGISTTQFNKYNTGDKFCNKLKEKQHVCCTAGDLPDFRPQPNKDGSCYSVDVDDDVGCWDLADAHYLTVKELEALNKETWGFAGCKDLQAGQKLCLSKGDPPTPNPISNAICGPQKPNGEARGNKKLAEMNPCPLNVCCNVWGQCGMDDDFCKEAPADTGAPGTSKPGANGCISNCGMNITNNDKGPASFSHIAYFEAWNEDRKCLHMSPLDIDESKYTHIHFSFPNVTPGDFTIDLGDLKMPFDKMMKMSGSIKRIVSLGGWAFSAEAPTYSIFREAVLPANRGKFAANVVSFVNEHGLDGIDFDWEYPAAEDLPDIPLANPNEGQDYLEFLKMVKRRLPGKSVSIAAPSSYWYLKGFPIKEISKVVDYIVYMTYDLHGQWDHGNKWSSSGCPNGNCLRSHINITETMTSLAMITKAGVPSYKVFVGIASYGRSFKMAKAGCTGPMCTFTGTRNVSHAMGGPCTDTKGYISSAEIREILWNKDVYNAEQWHDKSSDTDMVVYKDTEWVAWMNDKTKQSRIELYEGLNFGGVSDWAVDLDKDYGSSGIGDGDDDETNLSGGRNCPLDQTYSSLDALAADDTVADDCKPVIALNILETMLDDSLDKYDDVENGYDKNFAAYRRVMKASAEEAMFKFSQWREGPYTQWFDCDFKDLDKPSRDWKGPCDELADHVRSWNEGFMSMDVTLRDEDGFWEGLEDETGIIEDWVEFGDFKQNTEADAGCDQPRDPKLPICTPILYRLSVRGVPMLKDDFEIPDPKDIIKDVQGNLEEIRTGIAARFFDVVAGIWDGGNGDVVQVLSVPIFLLEQAIESMEEAKKIGAEILEKEREAFILNILSAILFFIPFVGEFAAMAAGAATVARMIAMASLAGNAALSIAEIAGDPSNAGMAIMALLSAGRVRKPRDFIDLGKARRAQTSNGVKKMGPTFKKRDDSLQKVLGNCRKEGDKEDDVEPDMCILKRDMEFSDLVRRSSELMDEADLSVGNLRKRQAKPKKKNCGTVVHTTETTDIGTYLTTPLITCSAKWTQACHHYSSVMSENANDPDMNRWTCWATAGTNQPGLATSDWGSWNTKATPLPANAQHHWEWSREWLEHDPCDRDEFPPRNFWAKDSAGKQKKGQYVRLLPANENRGSGSIWKQFCKKNDGFSQKGGGITKVNEARATTTSSSVSSKVSGGTTTYITSVGVEIPNAVFEINVWEHSPLKDDGLWDNPCWPSALLPNDPGWALLTDDPWYAKGANANARVSTALYKVPPPNTLTSGMTKSRTFAGRPSIAARDIFEDEEYDEMHVATCHAPGHHHEKRERHFIVDENGNEFEKVAEEEMDCNTLADQVVGGQFPAFSLPLATDAVPSIVAEVVGLEEGATPGSMVVVEYAKPT